MRSINRKGVHLGGSGRIQFHSRFLLLFGLIAGIGSIQPILAGEVESSQPDYSAAKENLAAFIRKEMSEDHVKGLSLALVDGDEVVWREGFGVSDEINKTPATADTLYRVDSVSKILTALEIMRLAGKGKIGLDDPLARLLPGFSIHNRFRRSKKITIRSLLAHHSGLPTAYHQGMWVEKSESLAGLVEDLKQDYLVSPPQSFYKYSDLDYSLLGRIIELLDHRRFAEAMGKNILKPLGMESSTFDLNPGVRERMAKGYREGKETPPLYLRDSPAGGMVSSADDMARLIRFIFTGKPSLVGSGTLNSMFREQYSGLPLDFGHHMGLGWMLNGLGMNDSNSLAWHDGDYGPFFCRVALLTKEKLGVVVLSNTSEAREMGGEIALRALKLMREAKFGVPADLAKPKTVMPALVDIPEEKINQYIGFYSGVGKAAEISKGGTHLRADLMGHQFDLVPTTENKFIPRIMILFFPIHIPQYGVEFATVAGKDVAILSGLGDPVVFEKIRPVPIPRGWEECLGRYRLDNPDGETEFKDMSLEDRGGLLTVKAKITSKIFSVTNTDYLITLESISDRDAIISGLFYPDGDTVHSSREGGKIRLYYAGLRFTRIEDPFHRTDNKLAAK